MHCVPAELFVELAVYVADLPGRSLLRRKSYLGSAIVYCGGKLQ